jgi:hypothetical protein
MVEVITFPGGKTVFALNGKALAEVEQRAGYNDEFTTGENMVAWKRSCPTRVDHLEMAVRTLFPPNHTMIPALLYDGNPFGSDHEYKGYTENGEPFVFACHRSSVPGASASWNDAASFAMYADNASISLDPRAEYAVHRALWPETETPRIIISGDEWGKPYYGKMWKRQVFEAWLFFGDTKYTAWKSMLDHAWNKHRRFRP